MKANKNIIWPVIIISYLGMFSFGLYDNSRGPIYPNILSEYSVSPALGSWIFSLSSLSAIITTLLGNWWLPALGAYRALLLSFFMQIFSSFFMGLSAHMPGSFYYVLISSFLFGLSSGLLGICANVMISKSLEPSHRRRGLSGLHAMYGLASLLAPLLLNLAYSFNIRWSGFFYLIVSIPLLMFILGLFINPQMDNEVNKNSEEMLHQRFDFKLIFLPCFIFGLYVASEIIVSSRLVYYVEEVYHFSKTTSNYYLSLFFLTLLIGRLTFLAIKFPLKSLHLMSLSLLSSLGLFVLGLLIHPVFLSFLGLTQSFFYPCAMDWIYEKYHKKADSLIPYIMTSISLCLILMHLLVGKLSEIYGIKYAMYLGPIFVIMVITAIIFSRRTDSLKTP